MMLSKREPRLRTICGVLLVANMVMLAVFQATRGGAENQADRRREHERPVGDAADTGPVQPGLDLADAILVAGIEAQPLDTLSGVGRAI